MAIDVNKNEETSAGEQGEAQSTPQKSGVFSKIKSLFSYKIQIVHKTQKVAKSDGASPDADEAPVETKKKKPKVKKDKKAKVKKAKVKKAKAKKVKKDASFGNKALIAVIIAVAVALCAGAAAFFILQSRSKPEALLAKARQYAADGEFDKSLETYGKLLDREDWAVEAYLGMADTLVAAEDQSGAVDKLKAGYEQTGDPRIELRLNELALDVESPAEPTDAVIVWKDAAMERMVRLALGRPSGDIMEKDVSGITTLKILGSTHASTNSSELKNLNELNLYIIDHVEYTERGTITTLDDLVYFKNLTRLTVGYNNVKDISGIAKLGGLNMLALYANEIEDITALQNLTNLQYLYLFNNHIKNLTPLNNLTSLRDLSIQYNEVTDISPLSGLVNLEELYFCSNKIENIGPIESLSKLFFLDARNNLITDISVVAKLPALTDISFTGNPVRDYSYASHVRNVNLPFGAVKG